MAELKLNEQVEAKVAEATLDFEKKVEQIGQVREQMGIELKRLRRQNFIVEKKFDEVHAECREIGRRHELLEERQTIADNTLAIVFKMMRISYALAHQDELDRQNVFLFGAQEKQADLAQHSVAEGVANNIDIE